MAVFFKMFTPRDPKTETKKVRSWGVLRRLNYLLGRLPLDP